ncbi:hypothetical protein M1D83_16680 [Enterobacteriaceae bacterium]
MPAPQNLFMPKNVGLGEAAKRSIGTGGGQIPDMGLFANGLSWFSLPSGHIVQFGVCDIGFNSRDSWPVTPYAIAFPKQTLMYPICMHSGPQAANLNINVIVDSMSSDIHFRAGSNIGSLTKGVWIAIGC